MKFILWCFVFFILLRVIGGIKLKTTFFEIKTRDGEKCLVNTTHIKLIISDHANDTCSIRLTDGTMMEGFSTDQKDKLLEWINGEVIGLCNGNAQQ